MSDQKENRSLALSALMCGKKKRSAWRTLLGGGFEGGFLNNPVSVEVIGQRGSRKVAKAQR